MSILIVASLVYVLNAHGPKGPKAKGRCHSTSYGDASMSNCGAVEDLLYKIYHGAIEQDLQTPYDTAAYCSEFISQSFRRQTMEGSVTSEGIQAVTGHMFMESNLLKEKDVTDIENVRYGPNFVAVDYKLEVINACDFGVSDVQATAVIICDAPDGKINDITIVRDMSILAPFMQNSMVCAQQLGMVPSGSAGAGGAALSEFVNVDDINGDNYYSLQLSSSQMTTIECIFGLIIICNVVLLCQYMIRNNNKKKTKYAKVNYMESDTDAL